jgi:hypothetical protein
MNSPSQIRFAVIWLYIVAATTLLNSLLLQLFSRFTDLLAGLWITQATDAIFVGMRSVEPQGASPAIEIMLALVVDTLVALAILALAVKISRRSQSAAGISFFVYLADTGAFVFSFGVSLLSHVESILLVRQALTLLVHVAGTVILFRAWRTLRVHPSAVSHFSSTPS